ncbi:MAG: hypothetical protein JWL90_827 [Chthoniobacteraceae bacterium]|nr:hypothetical protein [Chthoniobacteraceae bacterium]
MNSTSAGRSLSERVSVYLARAPFVPFSALLHRVLVILGRSAILFKQLTHAPDFQAGDGSFLSTDVAAELPPELQQSPVDPVQAAEMSKFIKEGWGESVLRDYFKAPNPLYATRIFIPHISADEGPKAYDLDKEVQPSRWLVHYQGKVLPSKDAAQPAGRLSVITITAGHLFPKALPEAIKSGSVRDNPAI